MGVEEGGNDDLWLHRLASGITAVMCNTGFALGSCMFISPKLPVIRRKLRWKNKSSGLGSESKTASTQTPWLCKRRSCRIYDMGFDAQPSRHCQPLPEAQDDTLGRDAAARHSENLMRRESCNQPSPSWLCVDSHLTSPMRRPPPQLMFP